MFKLSRTVGGHRQRRRRRSIAHWHVEKITEFLTETVHEGWPMVIRFQGRSQGHEKVTWWPVEGGHADLANMSDHAASLGVFAYHIQRGQPIPGLPPNLWATSDHIGAALSMLLEMPGGRPASEDQARAFFDRIPHSLLVPRAIGFSVERTGVKRRRTRVSGLLAWLARDAVAAAWTELYHAASTGASVRACDLCDAPYIRPAQYKGLWCPACRSLSWRQRERLYGVPKGERSGYALDTWKAILREKETDDEA